MFLTRGIAISFSVFVLVYLSLSIGISCGWRVAWAYIQRRSSRTAADALFGLRILPFLAAAVITVAFALPSFLLLEPRQIDEPLGWMTLALSVFGAGIVTFGVVNSLIALGRASRTIAAWNRGAQPVAAATTVPVLRITPVMPAMTATGILRPRILLSEAAEFLLTPSELNAALNHEMAHVRRRDNLRKLILRFVPFPGMHGLERAWLESAEMAADEAAVFCADEALELASALIKLSRPNQAPPAVDLTAALVHTPASFMNARVDRLTAWSDGQRSQRQSRSLWFGVGAAIASFALLAASYSQLLISIHAATEWLVR